MIAEVGLRCAAGVTAIWWRFAMSSAGRDGLKAGPASKAHGRPRPDPRAGVKAREATRVAGLALTPSTDQALEPHQMR
jgi:hypothetical protein